MEEVFEEMEPQQDPDAVEDVEDGSDNDEEEEEEVDDHEDEAGRARPARRGAGAKEPWVSSQFPHAEEAPDLREYFAEFPNVTPEQQVSICRAYSSYIASCGRAGKPASAKRPGPKAYPYKRGRYASASSAASAPKRGRFT